MQGGAEQDVGLGQKLEHLAVSDLAKHLDRPPLEENSIPLVELASDVSEAGDVLRCGVQHLAQLCESLLLGETAHHADAHRPRDRASLSSVGHCRSQWYDTDLGAGKTVRTQQDIGRKRGRHDHSVAVAEQQRLLRLRSHILHRTVEVGESTVRR